MKLKIFHRAGLLGALLFIFTAGQLRADLPPDAQDAMKNGIIAAKQQDYLLATRYFQDARKIAPNSPEIFFNLGLAESKIPGRELRAIAWFGAYLAATTNAPNAAAVKDQIDALDIKSQSNISHLIQSVQDADDQLPDTPIERMGMFAGNVYNKADQDRINGLFFVASLWASSGNSDEAMEAVRRIHEAGYNDPFALQGVVLSLAKAGYIADAIKDASKLTLGDNTYTYDFVDIQLGIAWGQIKAGDIVGAHATLESAKQVAGTVNDTSMKARERNIAEAEQASANPTPPQPMISVTNWIGEFDNLDKKYFLDLADSLKTPLEFFPRSAPNGPKDTWMAMQLIASSVIDEKNKIDQMLKQQAKQQSKP
jgi:tetratricopeptide (TPR) repeat protein